MWQSQASLVLCICPCSHSFDSSALQERGWATQLCAGVGEGGYERNSAVFLFDVNITLTEAGLAAGPGLGLGPTSLLFEFLAMLREAGPQR